MSKLSIRKIPGIGKVNEQILSGMDIKLCPDIISKSIDILVNFTSNAFDFLIRSALGISKNFHEDFFWLVDTQLLVFF
jgi:DNA polymerase kappa